LQRFLIKPEIATKVMQIFIILFSNSLKYSLEKSKIIVEITEIGKEVNCNIISKGYIIERKEWGKIFIKGRRLPNALDKPGSGLGLSIAYRLSKKIKADLRVKKSDNNETIFSFILIK